MCKVVVNHYFHSVNRLICWQRKSADDVMQKLLAACKLMLCVLQTPMWREAITFSGSHNHFFFNCRFSYFYTSVSPTGTEMTAEKIFHAHTETNLWSFRILYCEHCWYNTKTATIIQVAKWHHWQVKRFFTPYFWFSTSICGAICICDYEHVYIALISSKKAKNQRKRTNAAKMMNFAALAAILTIKTRLTEISACVCVSGDSTSSVRTIILIWCDRHLVTSVAAIFERTTDQIPHDVLVHYQPIDLYWLQCVCACM